MQHSATLCNTLQHTATHCNSLQHTATRSFELPVDVEEWFADSGRHAADGTDRLPAECCSVFHVTNEREAFH